MSTFARKMSLALASALALLAPAFALTGPAAAEEGWQADNVFPIVLQQLPGTAPGAVKAIYRLRDEGGNQLGPLVERSMLELVKFQEVPPVPGSYLLEGWLEDAEGRELRHSSAFLRFDDVAPAPPQPQAPARWLLGTEAARLEIGHPAALPLSGIRGYGVSLDRGG